MSEGLARFRAAHPHYFERTTMPKHATNTETIALLTTEVGRVLDGRAARIFDGHLVVDFTDDKGRIGGRILHAHDNSEIATFTLTVGAS